MAAPAIDLGEAPVQSLDDSGVSIGSAGPVMGSVPVSDELGSTVDLNSSSVPLDSSVVCAAEVPAHDLQLDETLSKDNASPVATILSVSGREGTSANPDGGDTTAMKQMGKSSMAAEVGNLKVKAGPVEKKQSWAQIVEEEEDGDVTFVVKEIDGKKIVQIPSKVTENAPPLWDNFVIGNFLSPAPHIANIFRIVNGIWRLGDKLKSSPVEVFAVDELTVRFKILDDVVKRRALHKEIWTIMGMPMIVKAWTPFADVSQPALRSFPLWIHLQNVPPSLISDKGFKILAKDVGKLRKIHPKTLNCVNLKEAQLFVDVDLTKDLPREFVLCGQEEGEIETTVFYSYPWLPSRCTAYRKWGHLAEKCLSMQGKRKEDLGPLPSSNEVESAMHLQPQVTGSVPPSAGDMAVAKEKSINGNPKAVSGSQKQDGNWHIPSKFSKPAGKYDGPKYDEVTLLARSRFASLNGKGENGDEIVESEEEMDDEIEMEGNQEVEENPADASLKVIDSPAAPAPVSFNDSRHLNPLDPKKIGREKKAEHPKVSLNEGIITRQSLRKSAKDPQKPSGRGSKICLISLGDERKRNSP